MKRVKLALTAVALVAVVGGALAFKASRIDDKVFIHASTDPRPGACTLPLNQYTTSTTGVFSTVTVASTKLLTVGCPINSIYSGE